MTDIMEMHRSEFVTEVSRSHGAQLLRYLQRMLGRKDLAEDLAQDAYLKLYRLVRPDEVTCPRALLFDVATKLAIDRLRLNRGEVARAEVDIREVPDAALCPDRRAMLDQAIQQLSKIIDQMQPSLRAVFVRRYVMQMPRQDIADNLRISVGAVEQRLTRALTHCREALTARGINWIGD